MPAPTPTKVRERIIALAKDGHSVRAIEAMLAKQSIKVGKSTVADLARQYRAGALPEPTKPAAAPAKPAPPKARSDGAERPAPAVLDAAEVADLDLEELAALARLLGKRLRKATRAGDARLVTQLLPARLLVSKEIARLRPPIPPDPANDPANAAAREDLRARLARAIDAGRRTAPGLEQLRAHLARAEEEAARRRGEAPAGEGDPG